MSSTTPNTSTTFAGQTGLAGTGAGAQQPQVEDRPRYSFWLRFDNYFGTQVFRGEAKHPPGLNARNSLALENTTLFIVNPSGDTKNYEIHAIPKIVVNDQPLSQYNPAQAKVVFTGQIYSTTTGTQQIRGRLTGLAGEGWNGIEASVNLAKPGTKTTENAPDAWLQPQTREPMNGFGGVPKTVAKILHTESKAPVETQAAPTGDFFATAPVASSTGEIPY